jgi:putative ABC transport system permease protein
VDPDIPIFDVKTHDEVIHESLFGITMMGSTMAVLGAIALVLASVGLYGLIANTVTERTHEVGVRMALGTQTGDVLRQILVRGIALTEIGLTIGLLFSFALAKLLSGLIFGVSATDMATFGGVVALLAFVSLAATYIPARRATRLDPLVALRHE